MSSYASDVERVKTYAPTSLSFRMMDCRTSSTRLPAANVSVKRLLTAARLRPSPLSKSDLTLPHDATFLVHPPGRMLGAALPRMIKRSVTNALKLQANQLNEEGEEVHDRYAFDSLSHEHNDDNVVGLNSSIPATIGTKSPAKGIHGEIINSAAPYLPNQARTLFSRSGLWKGVILRIPYFPKR